MNITDIRDYIKEHGSLKIAYTPDIINELSFFHIFLQEDVQIKIFNIFFNKQDDEYIDFLKYTIEKFDVEKKFVSFCVKLIKEKYQKVFKKPFEITNKQNFDMIIDSSDLKIELDIADLITESIIKKSNDPYKHPTEALLEKRRLKAERKTEHPAIKTRFIKRGKTKIESWSCIYRENGKRREKIVDKRFYTFEYMVKYFEENNNKV